VYCFANSGKPFKKELSYEKLKDFLTKYLSKLEVFTFTGGEPLIRTDLVLKLNDFLKSHGIKTRLFTNGFLLTKDIAKEFDVVQISLDSYRDNVHDRLRGVVGAFQKAVSAIEISFGKTEVWVRSTITMCNFNEISQLIDYVASFGISKWWARPLIPLGRGLNSSLILNGRQLDRVFKDVAGIKDDYKMEVSLLPHWNPEKVTNPSLDEMCPDLLITPIGSLKTCAFNNQILGYIITDHQF